MLFVLKDEYGNYINVQSSLASIQESAKQAQANLSKLNSVKQALTSSGTAYAEVQRYAGEYREDAVIDGVFPSNNPAVNVGSVTINPGDRTPNGLSKATVAVSVTANDLDSFVSYLNTHNGENAPRRFLVEGLSLPLDTANPTGALTASLQLGMYYFK